MTSSERSELAIVDDDAAVRESLQFLLEVAGHTVTAYASATDFLERCDIGRLAGLILDHHMPRMTGLELAAQVRARAADLPIMLITGSPSPAIVARAAELHIATVLEKPPAEGDLLHFIDGLET